VVFSGASHFPNIHPDVESMGMETCFQHPYGGLQQVKKLLQLVVIQLLQVEAVALGNDHQMPVRIRIFIHDYKHVLTLMEDEVFFILFLFKFSAKETSLLLLS